jgi:hypothetical protein
LESAILATVAPGAFTAIVRGKNNTTGVALVEVYNLSSDEASRASEDFAGGWYFASFSISETTRSSSSINALAALAESRD